MSSSNFQHLELSMAGDVALVELTTKDLQGPKAGQELGSELALVLAQDWARRILVDFRRTLFLSSSGFAARNARNISAGVFPPCAGWIAHRTQNNRSRGLAGLNRRLYAGKRPSMAIARHPWLHQPPPSR